MPFQRKRIQCSCTLTPYVGSKCLQNHLFLLNPSRDYYCLFCTFICIKHVFPFYSCYCISYNNTLNYFLDEIRFFHAMPNYDVTFVVNPIWHCSLFEKKQDMSKICYGIPNYNVMLIGKLYLLFCQHVKFSKLVKYCD